MKTMEHKAILFILAWISLFRDTWCFQCGFADMAQVTSGLTADKWHLSAGNSHNASATVKCVRHQPSSADVGQLCRRENCDVIQCVYDANTEIMCFSRVCEMVSLDIQKRVSSKPLILPPRVSLQELETLIKDLLLKNSDVVNIQDLIALKCADVNSILFGQKLQLQLTKFTKSTHVPYFDHPENLTKGDNATVSRGQSINVHLVYFRFLSRWESYIKFPKSHAVIGLMKRSSDWSVYTNEDFQSSSLLLEHNMASLLGNLDGNIHLDSAPDLNLVRLANLRGRCVVFNALGCHHPPIYDSIRKLIMSKENIDNCEAQKDGHLTEISLNVTSCGEDKNDADHEHTVEMRKLFSNTFSVDSPWSSVFGISIINVPDLTVSASVDTELSTAMSSLLHHYSDSIFFFMSDVGDPKFSRLDASTFLRQQTFNPFLITLSPKLLNMSFPLVELDHRNRTFRSKIPGLMGVSSVSNLLKTLIASNSSIEAERQNQTRQPIDDTRSFLVSSIVQGPVECICEGNRVRFSNDSIQSAFAALVVGSINNYFLDLPYENDHDVICERLTGVYFDNVYHVILGNSTYIIFAMSLTPDQFSKNPERLITLDAHLKYTTGNALNFSLSISLPGKVHQLFQLKDFKVQMLHQHVCRQSFEAKHEILLRTQNGTAAPSFGHFGVEAKVKPLHVPCLLLITTRFADSVILEVRSACDRASYQVTLSAELIDTISLVPLPAKVTSRPREIRYITSLVKAYYGAPLSAYKLSFKIISTD